MTGWSRRHDRQRGRRRVSRPVGCLLWVLALIVVLILLSALFGGFQKGTRVSGAPYSRSDMNVLSGLGA